MGRDAGDSTVEDLDQRITASREVRRTFEGQWLLNIAFFVGNQWLRFDGLTLAPYVPEDDDDPLIVDNRIQPAVRTEIAKLTKTQPTWIGVPRDSTDEEISSARLRERVFEHYYRTLRARRKLRLALLWSRVATAGFWRITWDGNVGPQIPYMALPNPETGDLEPVTMPDGRLLTPDRVQEAQAAGMPIDPNIVQTTKRAGDVRLDLRSPFAVFPDALATEEGLETCEYIGEEHIYSCDQLWKMLGATDDAYGIVKELEGTHAAAPGVMEGRMSSVSGIGKRGGEGYKGIRVREYWSLPSYDHREGRHVIWVPGGTKGKGGQVILEEPNPYSWLPYVMFGGTPVPGRFWPDCMTTQGVPLNTELNKVRSQIAMNGERIGNAPLRQSADSLPDDDDEDRPWRPGEKLIYRETGGPPPDFLRVPEAPAYVQAQIEWNQQSLKEVFRQYEVSQGTVPAGVTAASAISLLQESGDTVLSPDIDDASDSLLEAGRQVMGMVKRFASGERIARVAGDDGQWDIVRFRGEQLGDVDLDEVQIGSGIPDSRAGKQAAISQVLTLLLQQGQTVKPRDMRRVLRDYEVGGLDHILGTLNKDEEQIQDENRRLLAGEGLENPMPVFMADGRPIVGPDGEPLFAGLIINPFDNDEFHIEGHDEMCKSAAFRELALVPQGRLIQQGILAHVELHKTRLAERAASMGIAQAAGQEVPAPEPGSPNGQLPSTSA